MRYLKRLDQLLSRAVTAAQAVYGPEAAADPFRGLYITRQQAEDLLAREPGRPQLYSATPESPGFSPDNAANGDRLAWLADTLGLEGFDLDVILIALAPEIDVRYERLYAFLQDDVTRKLPTVDLVLHLLCASAHDRLDRRRHFTPEAPLVHHRVLYLVSDSHGPQSSFLSHFLKLDEQIVNFLLYQDCLDSRLASACEVLPPAGAPVDLSLSPEAASLPLLVAQAWESHRPLRLHFQGPPGAGKRQTAAALAEGIGADLLVADLSAVLSGPLDFSLFLKLIFRQALLLNAVLFCQGLEEWPREDQSFHYRQFCEALAHDPGITILAGTAPWVPTGREPLGLLTVPFPLPDVPNRKHFWQLRLEELGCRLEAADLDSLADRFRLTPGQIAEAVVLARHLATRRALVQDALGPVGPSRDELFSAARAQCGHQLSRLARKIEPSYSWEDIVLPDDTMAQLREICQRVAQRHQVLDRWGFDSKLTLGKGVNALFAGPSGTGKTMAAELVARELGLDLYKIDLSMVVSKYIGETEKNLDRIFAAAENANAILFFDEADALFGKRSEVRDSHDRYANIEISYLLQKIEEYEGMAILATNLRQHLDEAFVRRLAFIVHFPFPDAASRRKIWAGIWPQQTPLAPDVNLDTLAQQFKLSGGHIKNIALAAAFLAAADSGLVNMHHLLQATRREYQKMGKALTQSELHGGPRETVHG